MCGIAGVFDPARATNEDDLRAVAAAMADTLAHRGPDDHDTWVDAAEGIAFGHRRLAIIDLSPTGRQPMTSADGRYTVAYNGELYNHRELRAELVKLGARLRGSSDTEVLVESIAAWGIERALGRCNGMFAFALWDRSTRQLVLARDRLGEKPLFHATVDGRFVFASEPRAFDALRGWSPALDRRAAVLYLHLGFVPHPWSILAGVRQLPPGTTVTVAASGTLRVGEPEPYWSLAETVRSGIGRRLNQSIAAADDVDELDALLTDAVRRRLVADVPVGAFLSGGIDSSTVAALARQAGPVRTFTVRIPDAGLDESADAARVAAHLGTDHTTVELATADALATVTRLPATYGEPFGDPSAIPTSLVCRAAREHVTVCLSGDGGDEIFAGYNRHVLGRAVWTRARHVPRPARHAAAWLLRRAPARWDRVARSVPGLGTKLRDPAGKAAKLATLLGAEDPAGWWTALAGLWSAEHAADGAGAGTASPPVDLLTGPLPPFADPVEELVWRDTAIVLPDDMLLKVDRASMAVSLEARVPLLDHRVVELAWRLPLAAKIRDGRGKAILRDVLARYVPPAITERPKTGFDPPLGAWLRGPLRAWADDLLDPHPLDALGILPSAMVRAAWHEHLAGRADRTYDLWPLLSLQAWKEQRCPTAW